MSSSSVRSEPTPTQAFACVRDEEIVIARNGKPVARLVPVAARNALAEVYGALHGQVHFADWFLAGDERLGANAKRHLTDDSNRVLLSAAVVWEVAIKRALGKLAVADDYLPLLLGAGVRPLVW